MLERYPLVSSIILDVKYTLSQNQRLAHKNIYIEYNLYTPMYGAQSTCETRWLEGTSAFGDNKTTCLNVKPKLR